jgi:hypothetical protein
VQQEKVRLIGKDVLSFPPDLRTLALGVGNNDDFLHDGRMVFFKQSYTQKSDSLLCVLRGKK